ncbi:MAG: transglutaminase family protein [Planctomycetaceae bacterium]
MRSLSSQRAGLKSFLSEEFRRRRPVFGLALCLAALLFGLINTGIANDETSQASTDNKGADDKPGQADRINVEALAEQALKSLVVVRSTDRTGSDLGLGTGFAIEGKGLIATAYHVIGDGREISIELKDGRKLPVTEIFASSSQLDLAIVRVEGLELPPLALSAEAKTPAGREIVALGHPEGFRNAVVSGVVSGHQEIDGVEMLQLAMSIERGNSGGPVLDAQGQVVGIVTRKSALRDKLGFALPVRLLRDLQNDPNTVPMSRWSTIGALDETQWTPIFGGNWRQRAGRILVNGEGKSFGGRTLCLNQSSPAELPYDLRVQVKLESEEGAAGLVFHSDGNERHYGFYPSAGNLRLTRFDGPDVGSWTILHNEAHPAYRMDQWNTLTVRILKDGFECYVNGTLVVKSADAVIPPGKAGLAAFRGTAAEFRRFEMGTNLLPASGAEESLAGLRKTVDGLHWNQPAQTSEIISLLPLGETASDFLSEEADRLEQKSRRLRQLSADIHEAAVRKAIAAALRLPDSDSGDAPGNVGNDGSQGNAAEADLLTAALLIARQDNADVDVPVYIRRIDQMADELKKRVPVDSAESLRIAALDSYLFEELGVRGSRYEYESPSNSYLNEVIDDREGIPITLSVLYIELAKRLNLKVVGVGLPGHFVVRFEPGDGSMPQTIDVFERGKRLSDEDIRTMLSEAGFPDQPRFREAKSPREIIERMQLNLLSLAEGRRDDASVLRYLETLVMLDPSSVEFRAKRLEMRARTGRLQMAIDDATWFIQEQPAGVDVERVRELRTSLELQQERQQQVK